MQGNNPFDLEQAIARGLCFDSAKNRNASVLGDQDQDVFEPFDVEEQVKSEQWEEALTRLSVPNFEAVLTPHGHLLLKFSCIEVLLDRNEVEALTRFLEKEAGVEPLSVPSDEDLFAQD